MVQGTAAVGTRDWGTNKDSRSWLGSTAVGGCEGDAGLGAGQHHGQVYVHVGVQRSK